MSQSISKVSIVPLSWWEPALERRLPFELGGGISVENVSSLISHSDLHLLVSDPDEQVQVTKWSACLLHKYEVVPDGNLTNERSRDLLFYVAAHLRLIVPTTTSFRRCLQACMGNSQIYLESYSYSFNRIWLEDCEGMCAQIKEPHIEKLRVWVPWIIRLIENWEGFYPLYLSLHLSERARLADDPRIRHLLLVMALEALVSSKNRYGRRTFVPRIKKLLGSNLDLYEKYRCGLQSNLPPLILGEIIEDVFALRNTIAHGDKLRNDWIIPNRRMGKNVRLHHADELREAATSMLALVWNKIIDENLQETFADKSKMKAYFS